MIVLFNRILGEFAVKDLYLFLLHLEIENKGERTRGREWPTESEKEVSGQWFWIIRLDPAKDSE